MAPWFFFFFKNSAPRCLGGFFIAGHNMTKQLVTTVIYLAIAAIVMGGAWLAQSAPTVQPVVNDAGERFFEEFDPLEASALEIVRFDEEQAQPMTFRVAQTNGVWSIPSHENYPADGGDRLAQVAANVMDVTKGTIVPAEPKEHATYGLVDPTAEGVDVEAAGTRITLENSAGKALVDLIVGKEVKDSPGIHYVRTPGRDRVYTAAIDIGSVSTRFEDWIEADLLQLNPSDIREIVIDDYSIDEMNRTMVQGELVQLTRDAKTQAWSLAGIQDDEQTNSEKIGELTRALDELRIVDVRRKPAGLSEQLAGTEGLTLDPEAVASLASRGFYVSGNQLLANEGQTIVRMNDGVEYVLRFGEIALYQEGQAAEQDPANPESAEHEKEMNPGRYVFVSIGFARDAIAPSELKPVPQVSEATAPESTGEMGPPTAEAAANTDATRAAGLAERDRIIAENEQAQKAYDEKMKQGEERVRELNERFAPWYYIVPDSVYQQIRLTRAEVVQPKSAENTDIMTDDLAPTPMIEPTPEE